MALAAQYEVLFGIMQWDRPTGTDSPGSTLADAIVALYHQVKENPAAYPKGMTVRILTGNMPQLALFPVPDHNWHVLEDLRAAGLPELVNEALGWRVEIADFDGRWPHMHTKMMIVDGKTVMAAGFNYSYLHFAGDHPSDRGIDMYDLGIHITGPVAQAARAAYDDQWSQSDQLVCAELVGFAENVWRRVCKRGTAVADHIPEVLRLYVPEDASRTLCIAPKRFWRQIRPLSPPSAPPKRRLTFSRSTSRWNCCVQPLLFFRGFVTMTTTPCHSWKQL